jgi:hypothetical protein
LLPILPHAATEVMERDVRVLPYHVGKSCSGLALGATL